MEFEVTQVRRLNIRPVRPTPATTPSGLVQARGRQRTTSWRQPDGAWVVLLSPDGHTGHGRSPARSLPEPAPAYRTAGVEAQCPAGSTPEVVP